MFGVTAALGPALMGRCAPARVVLAGIGRRPHHAEPAPQPPVASKGTTPIDAAKNAIAVSSPKIGSRRRRWTGRIVMGRVMVRARRVFSSSVPKFLGLTAADQAAVSSPENALKIDLQNANSSCLLYPASGGYPARVRPPFSLVNCPSVIPETRCERASHTPKPSQPIGLQVSAPADSTRHVLRRHRRASPRPRPAQGDAVLLRDAFRPFYLGGSLFAALAIPLWLGMWYHQSFTPSLPAVCSHAYEMVFGFAVAIIIGFLFTANSELDRAGESPTACRWPLS